MDRADAAIFFLPPSPSDTNPPLGPAILARHAKILGLRLLVRDLNIEFINTFRDVAGSERYAAIGDQGKNRALVAKAAAALFEQFGIDSGEIRHQPDVGDPDAGMHYSLDGIADAVRQHVELHTGLTRWLNEALDDLTLSGWPPVVGVSIMGPSQVFMSLLFLALVKRRQPATLTVAGGSHVTLLQESLTRGSKHREYIDQVFPGHSEDAFARFVQRVSSRVPSLPRRPEDGAGHFSYLPFFDDTQLSLYSREQLALPAQFTRGCSYARCTYCTYPVVEPVATRLFAADAAEALRTLSELHQIELFSLKDSLLTVPMLTDLAHALLEPDMPRLRWSGTTKIVRSLVAVMPLLAASGLRTLEFGVESIHRRNLQLADKISSLDVVEEVIRCAAENGIVAVVNLMFGFPGELEREAAAQLDWARSVQHSIGPGRVDFSLNMLEVVRGSAMADDDRYSVVGIAPWAYSYEWSAPPWRRDFHAALNSLERRLPPPSIGREAADLAQ